MRFKLFTIPMILLILLFVAVIHSTARAQERNGNSKAASVSGRVTIEGKPAPGVAIVLLKHNAGPGPTRLAATTASEGRFNFAGVAPGTYSITPHAYAFVLNNNNP